jgi:hypothetical protein
MLIRQKQKSLITRRGILGGALSIPALSAARALTPGQRAVLLGSSSAAPRLLNVGTRIVIPDFNDATNKTINSRSMDISRTGFSNIRIRIPNFVVLGAANASPTYVEAMRSGNVTVSAVLEYPSGTYNRFKIGGANNVVINGVPWVDTDVLEIEVPPNTPYWYRLYYTSAVGVIFTSGYTITGSVGGPGNGALGDALTLSTTVNDTDITGGGTYSSLTPHPILRPMLAYALTSAPSVLVYGDSRDYGEYDTPDSSGYVGQTARSIGPFLNMAEYSISGDAPQNFLASSTWRRSVLPFFTNIIFAEGVNEFNRLGNSAATCASNVNGCIALIAAQTEAPIWQSTLYMAPTSTDNYATLLNQTPVSWDANRITENTRRRALARCLDITSAVESSLNSGKIPALSGYLNTVTVNQSVHLLQPGTLAIKASGVINPAIFHR